VGVGNDLRRDDGVGHVVTRAIARRFPGIETLLVHQVLPELAATLTGRRTVIFVDAVVTAPLAETAVTVRRLTPGRPRGGLGHVSDPAGVLALGEALDGSAPEGWIVTVPVADLGLGTGLSPRTADLVPEAVAAVLEIADVGPPRSVPAITL
jgi:hydrogenase maturation protease